MVALNTHCSLDWHEIYNFPSSASQLAGITDKCHHGAYLYCELFIMERMFVLVIGTQGNN